MKKALLYTCLLVLLVGVTSLAHAQATRTWVSGVGDDANPCSRTAPCKTYAGAISKTAAGGVISTLDPGGFGAVTITKSITIDGTAQIAGVLATTNAILINVGSVNDTVVLRNLEIHGINQGLDGVRIVNNPPKAVHVENCRIEKFTSQGMEINPSIGGTTRVFVRGSEIRNNTSHGIQVNPTAAASVRLTVDNSSISNNGGNGIEVVGGTSKVHVYDSIINANTSAGLFVQNAGSEAMAEGSTFSFNATGVFSGLVGNAIIRLSRCSITGNSTNGIVRSGIGAGTGTVTCFSNNVVAGNTGNETCTGASAPQI